MRPSGPRPPLRSRRLRERPASPRSRPGGAPRPWAKRRRGRPLPVRPGPAAPPGTASPWVSALCGGDMAPCARRAARDGLWASPGSAPSGSVPPPGLLPDRACPYPQFGCVLLPGASAARGPLWELLCYRTDSCRVLRNCFLPVCKIKRYTTTPPLSEMGL